MYKFINSEGSIAYNMATVLVTVKASARAGAASRWRAGMAKADPMSVCGLVKRQRTIGKGSLVVVPSDEEEEEEEEADDIESSLPASAAATALDFKAPRAEFCRCDLLLKAKAPGPARRFSSNDIIDVDGCQ